MWFVNYFVVRRICKIKCEIKRMSLLDLGSDECDLNFMNFKIDSFKIRKKNS